MLASFRDRGWDASMAPEPVLDPEAIAALQAVGEGDGGAFFRELVDIFLADTPQRLAEAETALAAGDFATAGRAVHSIKGSAGNFGASGLSRLAFQAESEAKAERADGMRAVLPALRGEFARVEAALRELRGP